MVGGDLGDGELLRRRELLIRDSPRSFPRHIKRLFSAKLPGSPTIMLFTRWELLMLRYLQENAVPKHQWLIIYMINSEGLAQEFPYNHHLQVEYYVCEPFLP